jgi:hypothetical protein
MNDGFLLADCAFDFLFNSDFIYHKQWKHNTIELYYTVSFFLKGTRASTISFEVTVSNGQHMITKSIIRLLEKRYLKDFNTIFVNCVIA